MNILNNLLFQPPQPPREKKQRRGVEIKSQREIEIMRQAAKIVATVLKEIQEMVQPGMTTADL
ncbi:type I methionyl aminopeptidase, partial [Coleofasciculus sp. FACHB-712]|nr:type I methionyl aminopeptidase [Coleofasciculus sp. FACHB-712]